MKSKIIITIAISAFLIYLYTSKEFLTINIYDTYYLISYFYIGLFIVVLSGIYYLLFFKNKNLSNQ
jgi:hypothetical protein